jgi:hypothetical protein
MRNCTRSSGVLPSAAGWLAGSTLAWAGADRAWGPRAQASVKAWPWPAVLPCTGNCSWKSPSSGMHSTRQTSQFACRRKSSMPEAGGLKSAATCTGTGSSTWPS